MPPQVSTSYVQPELQTSSGKVSSLPEGPVDIKYFPGKGFRKVPAADKLPPPDWLHISIIFGLPALAIYGFSTTPLQMKTLALAGFMYMLAGLGVTAGYHRMFSHRAWKGVPAIRALMLLGGTVAVQGSCRWWSRNHRAHHKFTDTSKDPYNVRKGFLYAHAGWMLRKQDPKEVGRADISDLNADWMIQFQHKYYLPLVLLTSIIIPTAIAGYGWGDARGGLFYACFLRMVFVHHVTFFVNSLAHYLGEQAYSDLHTAFDSVVTALLTLGEGYHNYHHEFPQDYRNGIRWYHYDPTKWFISILYYLGLAYDLRWIDDNEIKKATLQVKQAQLDELRNKALYGPSLDKNLPQISRREFEQRRAKGAYLVILEGKVFDVTEFVDLHPGGRDTLVQYTNGQDITSLFYGNSGSDHVHSPHAISMLPRYIVGAYAPHLDE